MKANLIQTVNTENYKKVKIILTETEKNKVMEISLTKDEAFNFVENLIHQIRFLNEE